MKNGLTTLLLLFFSEMPKIWVGRTTLNGEKKKRMAKLAKKLAIFTGLVQNIIEWEAENDLRNYTNRVLIGQGFIRLGR